MAELGSRVVSRARPPSLIAVALILSLALNVCAAGGYAYSQWQGAQRPAADRLHPLDALAARLALNPEQQAAFGEFRRSVERAQAAMVQQDRPLMEEAWKELENPTPDALHLEQLLDEMALHRHAFQVDSGAALLHLVALLTPDQRQALGKAVTDRKDRAGWPIRSQMGD